jgi:hypothetical protein
MPSWGDRRLIIRLEVGIATLRQRDSPLLLDRVIDRVAGALNQTIAPVSQMLGQGWRALRLTGQAIAPFCRLILPSDSAV